MKRRCLNCSKRMPKHCKGRFCSERCKRDAYASKKAINEMLKLGDRQGGDPND